MTCAQLNSYVESNKNDIIKKAKYKFISLFKIGIMGYIFIENLFIYLCSYYMCRKCIHIYNTISACGKPSYF